MIDDIEYLRRLILARCPEKSETDLAEFAGAGDGALVEFAEAVSEALDLFEERLGEMERARRPQEPPGAAFSRSLADQRKGCPGANTRLDPSR